MCMLKTILRWHSILMFDRQEITQVCAKITRDQCLKHFPECISMLWLLEIDLWLLVVFKRSLSVSSLMRVIITIIDQQVGIFDAKSFACTNRYHSLKFNTFVCPYGKLLVVLGYNPEYLFVDAQSRKVLMFDDLSIEDLV